MVKIVNPAFEIITPIDGDTILKTIEQVARTCYKSENLITDDVQSAKKLVKNLINLNHTAMIEHYSITVRFTTDQGFLKDITRHRMASFAIESTRWCLYSKDKFGNELTMIKPVNIIEGTKEYDIWYNAMVQLEKSYMEMASLGCKPDQCRMLLPHSTKADINLTANLREWRHIFNVRLGGPAHPSIKQLLRPLLAEFKAKIPVIFDDLVYDEV